jgi:hypothetical protein
MWTEIAFGEPNEQGSRRSNFPWDTTKPVEIPGTGLKIRGSEDLSRAAEDLLQSHRCGPIAFDVHDKGICPGIKKANSRS